MVSTSPADGHTYRLVLFGGPSLWRDGNPCHLAPTPMAALSVIAAHGHQGITRRDLCRILWGAEPNPTLAHRLRQLLYSISRSLPVGSPICTGGRSTIYLERDHLQTDLDHMQRSVAAGRLRDVASRVRLGFLPGLFLRNREAEEWLDNRWMSLRADLRTWAAEAWSAAEERFDWSEAAEAAELLFALDPEDERALRRLLRAGALAGRAREMEAIYLSFSERRHSQRDAAFWEPEEETREILAQIECLAREVDDTSKETLGSSSRGSDSSPSRSTAEGPIIGRNDELRRLHSFLRPPFASGLRFLVLEGEGGIGKSRLVGDCIPVARLEGALTLQGDSSEFEQGIPLNPILGALSHPEIGRAAVEMDEPWRSVVLHLMPGLVEVGGPTSPPPAVDIQEIPRKLFEALLHLLSGVAHNQPVVLFLDDFHWADETSVAVLEYLRRRWGPSGLRVILAVRPEELDTRGTPRKFLDMVTSGPQSDILHLEELDQDASKELVHTIAQGQLNDEVQKEILWCVFH